MAIPDFDPHPPIDNDALPPPEGQSVVDPVFNETVWRATDAIANGFERMRVGYSRQRCISFDGTLLLISTGPNYSQRHFHSAVPPYEHLRTVTIPANTEADMWWHPSANILYYSVWRNANGFGELRQYDYDADQHSVVHEFPYSDIMAGGENQLSLDGTRIALNGNNRTVAFLFDIPSKTILGTFDTSGMNNDEIAVTPSGDKVWMMVKDSPAETLLLRQGGPTGLELERSLGTNWGHGDLARGPDGKDYYIGVKNTDNHIYKIDLSAAASNAEQFFPLGWTAPYHRALHISANELHVHGYVLVSTYGTGDPDPATFWPPFYGENFLVAWDGTVRRICHNRTRAQSGIDTYEYTPRAAMSNGLIVFNSNYRRRINDTSTVIPAEYCDVFVVDPGLGAPPVPPTPTPPPGGGMSALDDRKAALTAAGIAFQETPEMSPPVPPAPTGRIILTVVDDSGGDEVIDVYNADGTLADVDAEPA